MPTASRVEDTSDKTVAVKLIGNLNSGPKPLSQCHPVNVPIGMATVSDVNCSIAVIDASVIAVRTVLIAAVSARTEAIL